MGHPYVSMVDNKCDGFQEKMERVCKVLSNLVKQPVTQFCRKYLLSNDFDVSKAIPEEVKTF